MNGEGAEDMDKAWRAYLVQRGDSKGWNPKRVFEAGYISAWKEVSYEHREEITEAGE